MRGDGSIYRPKSRGKESPSFWIQFCAGGKVVREKAGRTEAEARKKLRARIREVQGDRFVGVEQERLTVAEILDSYELHLAARKMKALDSTLCHVKPIRQELGLFRAIALRTGQLEAYQQKRLAAGKAPQTVDHELGALRAAFNLAKRQEKITRTPFVPMLRVDNRRQGFFERAEFEAVVANLPDPIADVALFAYASGWRRGEVVALGWEQIDRSAHEARLFTSKNGRPRVLPLEGGLWEIIERRWSARQYELVGGETALSPLVFHRRGRPVGDFRKVWRAACRAAGIPGRLFHDLRRSAVRDMVRAGVNQSVAMSLSGHRTISVFQRYDISSDKDKRAALRATETYRDGQGSESNVTPFSRELTRN